MVGESIAHYRILRKLGAGGMGIVYLAEDVRLRRQVAFKVLPEQFASDHDAIDRFQREARAVASLTHPGIAALYDIGEFDATRYLTMEYVPGRDLQDELIAGPLPRDRFFDFAAQIADAIEHAHLRGVLHRDLKPSNIMITPEGRVKVLDFGLAKILDRDDRADTALTATGNFVGTLQYCAPEVLRGSAATRLSDIYSFGVILYQMACGRLPTEGLTGSSLIAAIMYGQLQSPHTVNPTIDERLESLIMRTISIRPGDRPQSAADLATRLKEVAAGSTSQAPQHAVPSLTILAVLDFQNTSEDSSLNWLGTGLADTLTSDLKRLKLVNVISRERIQEASRRFNVPSSGHSGLVQLGRELGARWIVLGSFQRAGGRLRILPRMIEVASGDETAIAKVDGSWEDVFELQDRVVADVMSSLKVTLDSSAMERIAAPDTLHLEAYEQYAQGRQAFHRLGKESLEVARQHFERAVALDPQYAMAYAGLGATHAMRYIHRTDPADLDCAARYSERALELDAELGEPYPWLSYAYMRQGKVESAIRTGLAGVQRQPDLVFAHYFLGAAYIVDSEHNLNSHQAAVQHLLNATLADARWAATWLCLAQVAICCGAYGDAEHFLMEGTSYEDRGPGFGHFIGFKLLLGTLERHRGNNQRARENYIDSNRRLEVCDHVYREAFQALTSCGLGEILLSENQHEAAHSEFRRASRLVKEYPRMLGRTRVLARTTIGMSMATASTDEARARQLLEEASVLVNEVARTPQSFVWDAALGQLYLGFAAACTALSEFDRALAALHKAGASGWRDAHWLIAAPELAPLRSTTEFQTIVEHLRSLPELTFSSAAVAVGT
ncbi:MAG: protein kinase domain-containing protein [Terriglobales bacterium]